MKYNIKKIYIGIWSVNQIIVTGYKLQVTPKLTNYSHRHKK